MILFLKNLISLLHKDKIKEWLDEHAGFTVILNGAIGIIISVQESNALLVFFSLCILILAICFITLWKLHNHTKMINERYEIDVK